MGELGEAGRGPRRGSVRELDALDALILDRAVARARRGALFTAASADKATASAAVKAPVRAARPVTVAQELELWNFGYLGRWKRGMTKVIRSRWEEPSSARSSPIPSPGQPVVSSDHFAQALWGEEAPGTARKALQVHVSQLRKALARDDVLLTLSRLPDRGR